MNTDENKLLEEAFELLEKGHVMKENAVWLNKRINEECKKIDDFLDNMSWEEKENAYKRISELEGRNIQALRDLGKMDKEFRLYVKKVNKIYGREIIKEEPPLDIDKIIRGEE